MNFLYADTKLPTSTEASQAIKEKKNIDSMPEIKRVVIVDIQLIHLLTALSWENTITQ